MWEITQKYCDESAVEIYHDCGTKYGIMLYISSIAKKLVAVITEHEVTHVPVPFLNVKCPNCLEIIPEFIIFQAKLLCGK